MRGSSSPGNHPTYPFNEDRSTYRLNNENLASTKWQFSIHCYLHGHKKRKFWNIRAWETSVLQNLSTMFKFRNWISIGNLKLASLPDKSSDFFLDQPYQEYPYVNIRVLPPWTLLEAMLFYKGKILISRRSKFFCLEILEITQSRIYRKKLYYRFPEWNYFWKKLLNKIVIYLGRGFLGMTVFVRKKLYWHL